MNINNTSVSFAASGLGLDAEGRLALMVLEQQQTQEEGARADKSLARERYISAADREVEAMRDKADDVLFGALAAGAATLAASAIQVVDILNEPAAAPPTKPGGPAAKPEVEAEKPWGEVAAGTANGVSPVLGKCLGDSPAANDEAEAKRAASLAERARWQLDDANKVIDRSQRSEDKAIDWLNAVNANQASAETGIIAGLA